MAPAVLLDTHAFVWGQFAPGRLTMAARAAIVEATAVYVSAISFFEIAQKARLGKWPEIVPHLADLPALHERQGGKFASLDADIALLAGTLDWPHRDPFDRLLAATALARRWLMVSADAAFDGVVERVW